MEKGEEGSRARGNGETEGGAVPPPWVVEFLATLILTGSVREAVASAGTDFETAWALREGEPAFAMYWDRAVYVHKGLEAGLVVGECAACAVATVH